MPRMPCGLISLIAPRTGDVHPDDDKKAQRRVDARSNIFVVAALTSADGTIRVRIRNMSRTGALIEGSLIPPAGAPVRLSRSSLSVPAEIVWLRGTRAGVRFGSAVTVAEWLPRAKSATGQHRVDEIVYSYTAEMGAMRTATAPKAGSVARPEIEKELLDLSASLNAAAEELAADDHAMERHSSALQAIDVVAQKLEQIGRPAAD